MASWSFLGRALSRVAMTRPTVAETIESGCDDDVDDEDDFHITYRNISATLLSLTRSRSLPKGLQLHAHIVKTGFQTVPLVTHHLINFYSKTRLPLHSRQIFEEAPVKSSTTWSSVISSFTQNDHPLLALDYFRDMLRFGARPDDHIFPSATKACGTICSADDFQGFSQNFSSSQKFNISSDADLWVLDLPSIEVDDSYADFDNPKGL
ncbi:hypothetical protein RJ639_008414 [Escallonia herrerae]|uniref:Pentatricopeptide repeat-containing protein n=1 Tax=Escallonia herrerae TaxID=1293975 RepID=A0AA88VQQ6_9ASTE|nr:hypothetical protein RJ639_008414 [Escallonia herrerae]